MPTERSITSTPWGPSQQRVLIADGITRHHTASHGGVHLSVDRMLTFRSIFPLAQLWAGSPWFEEDCDAALVELAFPEHFTDRALYNALRSARGRDDIDLPAYFATERGRAVAERSEAFGKTIANRWEVASYGTGPGPTNWSVALKNVTNGERRREFFARMPARQFYSEAEIAEARG